MPRQRGSKNVYLGLIVALVMVGFVLQFQWMQRVRSGEASDITPNILAEKFSLWFFGKHGDAGSPGKEAPGVERITCNNCSGTGSLLTWSREPEMCPVCQGVGFRMIRRFDPADRLCPACGGMGRVDVLDGTGVGTCPRCGGRGMIHSQAADAAKK